MVTKYCISLNYVEVSLVSLQLMEEHSPFAPLVHENVEAIVGLRTQINTLQSEINSLATEKCELLSELEATNCDHVECAKESDALCDEKRELLLQVESMSCTVAELVGKHQFIFSRLECFFSFFSCTLSKKVFTTDRNKQ